jgi:hypothetical protein
MTGKAFLKVIGTWLLVAAVLSPQLSQQLRAEGAQPAGPKLKIGDEAPDFKLKYFDGNDLKDVSLSQYRGKKNVVLAFYIFAFTGG